jgi:hypothetical protein
MSVIRHQDKSCCGNEVFYSDAVGSVRVVLNCEIKGGDTAEGLLMKCTWVVQCKV